MHALADILRSDDVEAVTLAAFCLGLMESDAAPVIPDLQEACASAVPAVQLCAAEALLKVTPDASEPVEVLFEALSEATLSERWLAALALSSASNEHQAAAVEALIPLLHDAEADVAASAALTLGAYGPAAKTAEPDLQKLLNHSEQDVREAASAALACIAE